MKQRKPFILYLTLISVAFLWGTSFAAAKIGMRDLAPLNLAMFRFIIASAVFGGILLLRRADYKLDRADIPQFFVLGFLAITSYFYIQYTGLSYTTTINAALIIATSPIFTALMGSLLGWDRIGIANACGIGLAFSGVSLIITNGQFSGLFGSGTLVGNLLLLLNAVVWAGVTLYGAKILQKYSPFVAMAYIHIFGTLLLLPFVFFASPFAPTPLISQLGAITWPTVLSGMYLAVLCSVYSYYVWYSGVERLGAVRTSSFLYLNPLFAVITGVLLMGETFTLFAAAGGSMIILGVYITNKARARRQAAEG